MNKWPIKSVMSAAAGIGASSIATIEGIYRGKVFLPIFNVLELLNS